MRNLKSIAGSALMLTLICGVVVAALAATNLLTADTIAASEAAATKEACLTVLPSAETFEAVSEIQADGVQEVYEGKAGDGTTTGYVVKTSTVGKASGLVVMTGIDMNGTVCGVQVVSDGETAGYVDTVKKGGLLDRLTGITGDAASVDGVSQATKTSNGIKKGVQLALTVFEEVNGNG